MIFVLTAALLCSLLPGRECILCDLESVPEPRNGDRKCNEKKCVLTCEDNYFFYYEATSSLDVTCTPSGKWNITRRTPDCIALADKEHHVVVAPFGYTGPSQQIDIDVCQIYYMEYIVNQLNDLAVNFTVRCRAINMADSDKAIVVVIENERNIPFDIANLVTELLMTVDFTFAIRSDEVSVTEEGYNETVPLAQPIAVACGKLVTDTLKINTDTLLTELNTIPRNTILNCPKFTKNNETVVDQSWQCNPEELSPTGRCLPCPYGMYYSVKTTTCVNCEKGFFKNSTDRHPCMPCNKLVPLTKREGARSSDECRDKYGRTIKDIQKSLAESSSIIMIIVSAIGILAFLYLTSEIALIFRAKYVAKQKAIELQEMKKQLEQKSQMGEEESVLSLEQPMD